MGCVRTEPPLLLRSTSQLRSSFCRSDAIGAGRLPLTPYLRAPSGAVGHSSARAHAPRRHPAPPGARSAAQRSTPRAIHRLQKLRDAHNIDALPRCQEGRLVDYIHELGAREPCRRAGGDQERQKERLDLALLQT